MELISQHLPDEGSQARETSTAITKLALKSELALRKENSRWNLSRMPLACSKKRPCGSQDRDGSGGSARNMALGLLLWMAYFFRLGSQTDRQTGRWVGGGGVQSGGQARGQAGQQAGEQVGTSMGTSALLTYSPRWRPACGAPQGPTSQNFMATNPQIMCHTATACNQWSWEISAKKASMMPPTCTSANGVQKKKSLGSGRK